MILRISLQGGGWVRCQMRRTFGKYLQLSKVKAESFEQSHNPHSRFIKPKVWLDAARTRALPQGQALQ